MNPEPQKIDLADAAVRSGYSTKTLRRYIKLGSLPAVIERIAGRDGRQIHKIMIQVSDLDAVFPRPDTPDKYARKMAESAASAPRLTRSQRIRILAILYGEEA